MHELSIATSILEIIDQECQKRGIRRISAIKLVVGEMSAIVPDSLRFCMEVAGEGTPAEGAKLEIEERPIKAKCRTCGHEFKVVNYSFLCPSCQSSETEMVSGNELYIDHFIGEDD